MIEKIKIATAFVLFCTVTFLFDAYVYGAYLLLAKYIYGQIS